MLIIDQTVCVLYNVSLNPNQHSLNWISVAIYQKENLPLGITDNINLRTDKVKLKFKKKEKRFPLNFWGWHCENWPSLKTVNPVKKSQQ